MVQQRIHTDTLIIGSGIAGLSAALAAAELGTVTVISKKAMDDCNTAHAQGGIACVVDAADSIETHVQDTLAAGAGLCDEDVVRTIIAAAPDCIDSLIRLGIQFTREAELHGTSSNGNTGTFNLGREGGHSVRRVLHHGDTTGREILRGLLEACNRNPAITLTEQWHAVDLISTRHLGVAGPNRCLGAYVLDCGSAAVHTILARFTMLATGGAGKVYLYTSNPDVACGGGVAMGYRAFADISNMEFFQFHPTCLFQPQAKSFLVSEAVRGEGAILKIHDGSGYRTFVSDYDEQGDLATRDIVARAIDRELKRTGQPCVYLDIRHHEETFLKKRFPTIFNTCLKFGINMANDLIPVVPAAHYSCGGVRTDVHGVTSVENLYAIGEVGCTGFHGANRLASNSLLEAVVVANLAVEHSRAHWDEADTEHLDVRNGGMVPGWSSGEAVDPDELIVISHNWEEIRRFMWDYVGIFRTRKRLERAKVRANRIRHEIEKYYWDFILTPDLVELRNMASVAEMIIDSALARKESIGLHFNADCPGGDPATTPKETVLNRAHAGIVRYPESAVAAD